MSERPMKTVAIKKFLEQNTHADLAALYSAEFECQVNVSQDGGRRIEGEFKGRQWAGWTNGVSTWKSFRIPWKANDEPEYLDSVINFDLSEHAEGIGMTGWDWVRRISKWVAFDFDAMTGHSERHARKLSATELEEVAKRLFDLEFCTVRKSTSGKGIHLYIFLPDVTTQNHNEHAALARAILSQLSAWARYDFSIKVDARGGNMWVWHRKMQGTDGLSLLKQGTILNDIPVNWRDHINVVKGHRHKTLPTFIEQQTGNDIEKWYEDLSSKQSRTPLDNDHMRLITYLREHNACAWWDADRWMLVTHTWHLKQAHEDLQLKGAFETLAQGTESPHDHNCFLFPKRNGTWTIRRYTPGIVEHPIWQQDKLGWTTCDYNCLPDLKTAAKIFEGLENPSGGFTFSEAEQAKQTVELLGATIELPPWIMGRRANLKENKQKRLIVEIEHDLQSDTGLEGMKGWIVERGKYKKVLDIKANDPRELDVSSLDDLVRHVITSSGDDAGWLIQSQEKWKVEPLNHIKAALTSLGFNNKDINAIIGTNVIKCWTLVNRPFQDEYPSGREWNRNAVQLAFKPNSSLENLNFPTWNKILQHIGSGLNKAISDNKWCKDNAI